MQARWPRENISFTGNEQTWSRITSSGSRTTYRLCPTCGSTIAFASESMPAVIAIPVGAFANPGFPAPTFSVFEESKHAWLAVVGDGIEHRG